MTKKRACILAHASLTGCTCIDFQNYFSRVNHTKTSDRQAKGSVPVSIIITLGTEIPISIQTIIEISVSGIISAHNATKKYIM